MNNNIDHPIHYTQGDIECIDALKAATVGKTGIEAVCVANVIKYLFRYENKNGLEDVRKAAWYLNRLIQELEQDETPKYTFEEYSCDSCKHEELCLADFDDVTGKCKYEPCKSCKCDFVPGTKEFEEAPFNYEPRED